ncbi:hypothetical protein [Riemerella columbipharyngis]|uniref:Long-chain fatty acid transport protein n=1 Tax=Riemerella columbipharyngis TaxID=1071918 RepID=A0A1G7DUR8_9FLAO|nr:hypothetical protein [Riemerella columbipharyngis]SDE54715.1 Long-chain fatty acid transport protein [Riemerella columbipharyngis]
MKKIALASLIILGKTALAQSIGNSPYAAFGVGDVKYDNNIETSSMGGISAAYISDFNNSFNFKNPAANKNLELTSFRLQANNENIFLKSNYNNVNTTKHSTYLSNISIAFPLSPKMKFGIRYQPYSSKKYEMITRTETSSGLTRGDAFTGSGTLNTIQAALSYSVTPEFSLGARSNFYFGKITDLEEVTFSNVQLVNGFETYRKLKTWNFTLGTTFQKKIKNDRKITVGGTYTFGNTGSLVSQYTNSTYFYSGNIVTNQNIIEESRDTEKNIIPQEATLGIGYGKDGKWFVSSEFDYKKGGNIRFMGVPTRFNDSYRIAVGGWYLPNFNNFRNYFSRVIYRYGAYYEKGTLNINGTNIDEYGVTLGATLPFSNNNVMKMNGIDIGLDIGNRGTLRNNMISERFVNLKIGLHFADKWFNKRQYD